MVIPDQCAHRSRWNVFSAGLAATFFYFARLLRLAPIRPPAGQDVPQRGREGDLHRLSRRALDVEREGTLTSALLKRERVDYFVLR